MPMQMISPVNAETCAPYLGRPICAVLHDGSRYFGYLHAVDEEKLTLRMQPTLTATSGKKKKRKETAPDVQTSAYPGYGFYPPPREIFLDLALIALLILVPFLW